MKLIGAGAALASLPAAQAAFPGTPPLAAGYFPLSMVRLGAGPFLAAQQLDATYLLQLEPDRLLHNFRLNAGLEPKAPVYGGWESVEPWIDIRCHGHTLGHYLTACACMYASTDDERFAARVDHIVAELAECQAKTGGWLTAFPDGVAPLTDSLAGKPFAGVPWYTTHKVLAGLRDAYWYRGSEPARQVLLKFCDWIDRECAGIPDERFQKMLDREHGGMTDVLVDAHFMLEGNGRFLDLAQRFVHRALFEPLAAGRDALDGLHANTQIPKVIGFSRLEGADPTLAGAGYKRAAKFFWDTVVDERSFATGGHGDVEHFFPKHEFAKHLGSGKTMETCCTHNMMALTRRLFGGDPRVAYFDYYERALFNGILASQDPQTGMNTYFQSTRPGYVRLYHTPFDSFWCCTGSGIENHARYGESIYARGDNAVYVNLFIASTLDWHDSGIGLTQHTRFPDEDTTRLVIAGVAQRYTIALRQPAWCPVMMVSVNGRRKVVRRPGEYYSITRRFQPGDAIDVRLPMSLALEPLPNSQDGECAALRFGPIVLAGRMGTTGLAPGSQLIINERKSGEMLQADVPLPRWTRPLSELLAATTRLEGESLRFVARGFEGDTQVELIPWFRATNERYNLYWRRSSAASG